MKTKQLSGIVPFDTWEEAYSACRECDRPIRVCVSEDGRDEETGTVYPSGHFRPDSKPAASVED